mgnify:FL=1
MVYEPIAENENGIIDEIFHHLLKNEIITEKELVSILEHHNQYIVGLEDKKRTSYGRCFSNDKSY